MQNDGLPVDRRAIHVDGLGMVTICADTRTIYVQPFRQPQPYFYVVDGEATSAADTTDGIALLTQFLPRTQHEAIVVRAPYELLAAMMIAPHDQRLTVRDLMDATCAENYTEVIVVPGRWGFKHGGAIFFASDATEMTARYMTEADNLGHTGNMDDTGDAGDIHGLLR